MKNLSRRDLLKAGLVGVVGGGCKNPSVKFHFFERISHKLEDLCDTEVDWKDIKINVHIEPSEILWDYHKYKDEIFEYVKGFFKEQKINCEIGYSNKKFEGFDKSNEFGLEIWDSKKEMESRFWQLSTEIKKVPKENPLHLVGKGYAVTRAGVALINGGWEEFRDEMRMGRLTIEEIEEQFLEEYKDMTKKEYHLKSDIAANICHELGHCMSLFHVKEFNPLLVDVFYKGVLNANLYKKRLISNRRWNANIN